MPASPVDSCSTYGEDICLQTFFCYLNVQNAKQKNPLYHQPIVMGCGTGRVDLLEILNKIRHVEKSPRKKYMLELLRYIYTDEVCLSGD